MANLAIKSHKGRTYSIPQYSLIEVDTYDALTNKTTTLLHYYKIVGKNRVLHILPDKNLINVLPHYPYEEGVIVDALDKVEFDRVFKDVFLNIYTLSGLSIDL